MRREDARNRGKANGSNQLAGRKDKTVAQHECLHNDSNATVVAMVTARATARMATMVAGAAAKSTVATAKAGGIGNNKLKAAAEETAVAATETAMATKMLRRRHS
jgi:hypothetical protein